MINKEKLFLLEEIVKKNFAAKYKDSYLGILWSVIKPLLIMILLTIIFSTLFARRVENYPVFFLSGKCIYDFFSAGTTLTMNTIKYNKNILKTTPAPKYIFLLGGVISEFLNFIITLIILIAVMIVARVSFPNTIIFSVLPIASLLIMITGIGLTLSILRMYYTDIEHLWSVALLMGMYASAIFYPMDIIPEPYHGYLILNPVFWIINQFRSLALYGTIPDLLYIINSFLISLILLIFGIIIFKKFEKQVTMKF
ncbi:MAG: ABC transporter permease [Methanobrevibacter sp.]|nr:ABC transporter permease [Methanobrevibacter sp.]